MLSMRIGMRASRLASLPAARVRARYPTGLREIVGGGPFQVKPGQVTDDGELALALARCLVEAGRYEPDRVAAAHGACNID